MTGLAAAINAQSGVTGITAVADNTNGKIDPDQCSGYDIGVQIHQRHRHHHLTGTLQGGAGPRQRKLHLPAVLAIDSGRAGQLQLVQLLHGNVRLGIMGASELRC